MKRHINTIQATNIEKSEVRKMKKPNVVKVEIPGTDLSIFCPKETIVINESFSGGRNTPYLVADKGGETPDIVIGAEPLNIYDHDDNVRLISEACMFYPALKAIRDKEISLHIELGEICNYYDYSKAIRLVCEPVPEVTDKKSNVLYHHFLRKEQ